MSSLTLTEFSSLMQAVFHSGGDVSGDAIAVSGDAASGDAIAVAVSGGADSLALTLLLGQWCKQNHIHLTALTVDHGLRPEAYAEARTVHDWLHKYDIAHVTLTWEGDKPHSNIQNLARLARYRLMGEWCQDNGVHRLFFAHHQGDQAETFLIRLFRGSGVNGLSAMKAVSDFPVTLSGGGGKILVYRPLLGVKKGRLELTLRDLQQNWIEDPSNRNESYMRVKVRNLLAQNDIEGLNIDRMAQTAARMGRVQSLLQSLTDDLIIRIVTIQPEGYVEVCLPLFLVAHEELALRCLAQLICMVRGGGYSPRLASLESLYSKVKRADFSGQTLGGCLITPLTQDRIMISREPAAIDETIVISAGMVVQWDGRFIVENKNAEGILKKLELAEWRILCQHYPDYKRIKLHKVIRDSLPCILCHDGRVILPNFMAGFEENGFKIKGIC